MTAVIKMRPEEMAEAIDSGLIVISGRDISVDGIKLEAGTDMSLLRYLESEATKSCKKGWQEFTRAGICLEIIRKNKLHSAAGKTWGEFFDNWVEVNAKGRTEFYDMLKTIRIWTGPTVQGKLTDLLDYEEGVGSIEPLFVGPNKIIEQEKNGGVNRKDGAVKALTPEWEEKLEGETTADKVRAAIADIPRSATKKHTTQMLRNENPAWEISIWKRVDVKTGRWYDISWEIYTPEGKVYRPDLLNKEEEKAWGKGFALLLEKAPEPILKQLSRRLRCQGVMEE